MRESGTLDLHYGYHEIEIPLRFGASRLNVRIIKEDGSHCGESSKSEIVSVDITDQGIMFKANIRSNTAIVQWSASSDSD